MRGNWTPMGLFGRIFGRPDSLAGRAHDLVKVCRVVAVPAFVALAKEFSFLAQCEPAEWEFFATVAAARVALDQLKAVSAERYSVLSQIVVADLRKLDPQGEAALIDCNEFIKRGKSNADRVDLLGLWIVWNLVQRKPTLEETQAAPVIGHLVAKPMMTAWPQRPS